MKKAFSMFTAIFVILVMASVATFVLSLSGKSVKATTVQYQRAQAMLYAKSYTEYAILAITGHDRSTGCLNDITAYIKTDETSSVNVDEGNGYRVRVRIAYIGTPSALGGCGTGIRILSNTVMTEKTPLSALIDVYVDYKDPDDPNGLWLTTHRRTIQKI